MSDDELVCDLKEARAVIADEASWAKNAGINGVNYCAISCVVATSMRHQGGRQDRVWTALENALPKGEWERSVPSFNDDPRTTHADVMALFDAAIAKATGEAS